MERRRRRRGLIAGWYERVQLAARWCGQHVRSGVRAVICLLRPWKPVVLVDSRRARARRLRRVLSRATRTQFRALGVTPPQHLLIVVQRTVVDGDRPLASLLQVFEQPGGDRRHVLFLALAVGEESMSDGAIVAMLRQQLHEVAGDALGSLVCSVPCTAPRQSRPAAVVPLRHVEPEAPPFDEAPPPDDHWAPTGDGAYAAAER